MVYTFIISKNSIDYELHVNGKVEVKPMPHAVISEETIKVLARVHEVFFKGYYISLKEEGELLPAAIRYFNDNGFIVREKQVNQ